MPAVVTMMRICEIRKTAASVMRHRSHQPQVAPADVAVDEQGHHQQVHGGDADGHDATRGTDVVSRLAARAGASWPA
jgi:hypothetical protein